MWGELGVGRWHDLKLAIGSSFHVKITKITKITNCMRSQITNRGSQNFCDRQFVILERTENGKNSRFFVAKAPHLSLLLFHYFVSHDDDRLCLYLGCQ